MAPCAAPCPPAPAHHEQSDARGVMRCRREQHMVDLEASTQLVCHGPWFTASSFDGSVNDVPGSTIAIPLNTSNHDPRAACVCFLSTFQAP